MCRRSARALFRCQWGGGRVADGPRPAGVASRGGSQCRPVAGGKRGRTQSRRQRLGSGAAATACAAEAAAAPAARAWRGSSQAGAAGGDRATPWSPDAARSRRRRAGVGTSACAGGTAGSRQSRRWVGSCSVVQGAGLWFRRCRPRAWLCSSWCRGCSRQLGTGGGRRRCGFDRRWVGGGGPSAAAGGTAAPRRWCCLPHRRAWR